MRYLVLGSAAGGVMIEAFRLVAARKATMSASPLRMVVVARALCPDMDGTWRLN